MQKESTTQNVKAPAAKSGNSAGKLFPAVCVLLILFLAADIIVSRNALGSIRDSVTIEAGSPLPAAEDFLTGGNGGQQGQDSQASSGSVRIITDLSSIDTKVPGTYPVKISTWIGKDKTVSLVIADTTPPVITGVTDLSVEDGESISYLKDVAVSDNSDPDPKLEVDNSAVDLDTPGSYKVIYTATDASDNSTTAECTVTVQEKPAKPALPGGDDWESDPRLPEVFALADSILGDILTDDMNDVEKAFNIYVWVKKHVHWRSSQEEYSYIDAALEALRQGAGNCIYFASALKMLLGRAGFETIDVERYKGATTHYWCLLKLRGEWYHCDATPRFLDDWVCFLKTDAEIAEYTKLHDRFYSINERLYPRTPAENTLAYAAFEKNGYVLHWK